MAGKDINKLKNLFFFGVSYVNYDSTDVTLDIITNIRRRFLVTRKPASNKLYRSAQGESFVYSYNFSFDRPLQWKVSRNRKTVEEIEHLLAGKYCINLYDEQGKDLKKTFFDSKHRWFKTNYYSPVSNENLSCTLVPKEFDEGTSILKYITGEVYPERLFACTIPSCDVVKSRVLDKIPTPSVTALTNLGVVYFMTEVDKENYEHILSDEEALFAKENAPESFVSEEDAATGFNLSVKDFDMSKNLNRTFDISLAQDFDDKDSAFTDVSEPESESETEDDGSVNAAISDAVEQINALTSLEIDADEILNFDISALNNDENEDIIFADSEPTIDIQLRHIESVLDENALLNSEHKLMVGDSVVDDDYISSIIDGIIASAFESDEEAEEILDEAAEVTEAEEPITEEESVPVCLPAEDFIKETPADLTIESRGESYYYYGSVDEKGKRSGKGRTLMSDGSIAYEGFYEDDKRKGQGSFYFKDGTLCYWGNWSDNVRSGFGVGVSSEDKAIHIGNWSNNKPEGLGARFDKDGNLMFISTNCDDKKKGFTISDFSDTSFTIRVWSEKDDAFVQQEISINDILK